MARALRNEDQKYTYADYLNWPDDNKYELIEGTPYDMSPSPSTIHQTVSMELSRQFANYLVGKKCRVFAAPFDVRLSESDYDMDDNIKNVVQPDIAVVCDSNKIDKRGCKGAPDLIIEIVSQSTFKKDMKDKFYLYEKYGVREYWMVYPNEKTVSVFKIGEGNRYGRPSMYSDEEKIEVGIFEDLVIDLKGIFIE